MDLAAWPTSSGNLEETKRVARLLDMIVRISTRPKMWTRRALAQAYEISERRIQDDLNILIHRLHLPLAHCRSGYYLERSQSIPSVTFAFGEAVALLLAADVGRATGGVDSTELTAAFARLREAFPAELQRLIQSLEARPEPNQRDTTRSRVMELLQEAIATRTTVRMHYVTASRSDAESERDVDPYLIIPYVRSFHLVGYCHKREEVRIFKVDRIRELTLTGKHFEPPEGFSIDDYLGESWGLMRGVAREPEQVRILFSPRAGRWVSEERWHPGQEAHWQPDGSLLFTLRVGVTPVFVRWILYYGGEAKVLEPAWLAKEVQKEAAAVLKCYQCGSQ